MPQSVFSSKFRILSYKNIIPRNRPRHHIEQTGHSSLNMKLYAIVTVLSSCIKLVNSGCPLSIVCCPHELKILLLTLFQPGASFVRSYYELKC